MEFLNVDSQKCVQYITNYIQNTNNHSHTTSPSSINDQFIKSVSNICNNICNNYIANYNKITVLLNKVHKEHHYPLIYVFMKRLYELNLLDSSINYDNHIFTNFNLFVNWYRLNHQYIDLTKYNQILNTAYQTLNYDENITDLIFLYRSMTNIKGNRQYLHNMLYGNMFVALDTQKYAESNNLWYTKWTSLDTGININIYYPTNEKISDAYIDNIFKIIYFIQQFVKSTNKPDITLFLSPLKKYLPNQLSNTDHLAPNNVNSGSTHIGKNIVIWRSEEIEKVLIHELIHFYNIDFHYNDSGYNDLNNFINNTFWFDGIDRANESFTETLAIILHTIFVSCKLKQNPIKLLDIEINFALFQISKILHNFGIQDSRDIIKINTIQPHNIIRQTTSVLSYYIIKGIILLSLSDFIDFLEKNNYSVNTPNKIANYIQFLSTIYNNPKFYSLVNAHLTNLKYNTYYNDDFVHTTLRMTCIQVNGQIL